MESIIKDEILLFMINNNLLANFRHGFVPGKSCQSNLLSMLNILADVIERSLEVDLVYLDFAKVFDLVPRRKLIYKWEKYGNSGQLLLWLKDLLLNRRQQVCELEILLVGDFFTRRWEPEEEWFWWFEPFSKLKTAFCE